MNKSFSMKQCDACGRSIRQDKLKPIEEQFKSEPVTSGLVRNYYHTVYLCPRCRILRVVSILIGIIGGFLYGCLWANIKSDKTILIILFWLFNPIVIGVFTMALFRVITKCDTLDKKK